MRLPKLRQNKSDGGLLSLNFEFYSIRVVEQLSQNFSSVQTRKYPEAKSKYTAVSASITSRPES